MKLEYIKPRIFNKIAELTFKDALSKELTLYENGTPEKSVELTMWQEDEWFLNWCKTDPKLSGENLKTYFYFTRTSLDEKISRISSVLSPMGQEILNLLMSKADTKIKQAIEESNDLSDNEAASILEAMNSSMLRETTISNETIKAFLKFAQQRAGLANDALSYLQSISGSKIGLGCASYIAEFAKATNKKTEVLELASQWEKKKLGLFNAIESLIKN